MSVSRVWTTSRKSKNQVSGQSIIKYYNYIIYESSKSEVTSSWSRQIWDMYGKTFLTCWRLADWSWKSFPSFSLKIHFWDVPEGKNAVQPNSYSKRSLHPILNFHWPVRWNSKPFSSLFPLEIDFWGVPGTKKAVQPKSDSKESEVSHFKFSVINSIEFQ